MGISESKRIVYCPMRLRGCCSSLRACCSRRTISCLICIQANLWCLRLNVSFRDTYLLDGVGDKQGVGQEYPHGACDDYYLYEHGAFAQTRQIQRGLRRDGGEVFWVLLLHTAMYCSRSAFKNRARHGAKERKTAKLFTWLTSKTQRQLLKWQHIKRKLP